MIPGRAVHIVYYHACDCCMTLQNAADRACFRVTAKLENRSLTNFVCRVLPSIHYHKDRVLMSAQKHPFSPFLKERIVCAANKKSFLHLLFPVLFSSVCVSVYSSKGRAGVSALPLCGVKRGFFPIQLYIGSVEEECLTPFCGQAIYNVTSIIWRRFDFDQRPQKVCVSILNYGNLHLNVI